MGYAKKRITENGVPVPEVPVIDDVHISVRQGGVALNIETDAPLVRYSYCVGGHAGNLQPGFLVEPSKGIVLIAPKGATFMHVKVQPVGASGGQGKIISFEVDL